MKQLVTALILFMSSFLFGQTADAALKKGQTKYGAKDYKGAIADFTKAATLNPKNATAFYYRASCKQNLQDYKGAIDDYTKAIKLKPTYAIAYTNRARSKYISLEYAGTTEDYKAIIADYTKAIELNPRDTLAYLNRGITKEYLKDYKGGVEDFRVLCELIPTNGEAFYCKANCEDKAGNKEAACVDWDKALELGETRAQPLKAKNCNQ
jgi:tetratricopeptide (TPR) repeat protein